MSIIAVTNLQDAGPGSLRAALAQSTSGDTITFASGLNGTIALGSGLVVSSDVTIIGPTNTEGMPAITLDGQHGNGTAQLGAAAGFTILTVGPTTNVSISNLGFSDGFEQGGAYVQPYDTDGISAAGAILNNGSLDLLNASFSNDEAAGGGSFSIHGALDGANAGGAILNEGTLSVVGSSFSLNEATGGNDISYEFGASGGSAAGAIFNDTGATLLLDQATTFSGDQATAGISTYLGTNGTAYTDYGGPGTTVACYARGTAIRTDHGNAAVEKLTIGYRVATFDGSMRPIRWIGRRAYSGRFLASNPAVQPILFKAGSLGPYQPRRDLRVSPKHAMFLHGCLVPAECLLNGSSVVRDTACTEIEYFHVELDSHDVILAEDAPSETFVDDNSRSMFHNVAEYRALYGDRPVAPAIYCAPRIEDGERLEEIRRAFGLTPVVPGALRGYIDDVQVDGLRGWAQDPDQPEVPVCLEIVIDGDVVGRTMANLFRADLTEAGLGSGCHGFTFALPAGASHAVVEVRRAGDHARLGSAVRLCHAA